MQILLPDNILTKSDAMEARHIVRHITEEQRREIRNIVVKLSIVSDELPEQWYYLSKSSASEALCGQVGVVAHCKFPKITVSIEHSFSENHHSKLKATLSQLITGLPYFVTCNTLPSLLAQM